MKTETPPPSRNKATAKPAAPKPRADQHTRRSLLFTNTKSTHFEDDAVSPNPRSLVQQFARPRRQPPPTVAAAAAPAPAPAPAPPPAKTTASTNKLILNLESQILGLKSELEKAHTLNLQLHSHNTKLSLDLAAAHSLIASLNTPSSQTESAAENQQPKFEEIHKIIAKKLEFSTLKKETTNAGNTPKTSPTAATNSKTTAVVIERKVPERVSTPAPPPPPLPPLHPARAAATRKAPAIIEFYHSLKKHDIKKDPAGQGGNLNKLAVTSAHNSIVGEIQNRSAHQLAIKTDIETKGEFINSLIQKVLDAAYSDIEDVVIFVDWLDKELSTLADEQAVLKHFQWPEKKADAMREAAIEYRHLKLLESAVSLYKDDANIPCGAALKKMAILLDKLERSIQRLISLRSCVILPYQKWKIPTDWMLDSGIVYKIKQASMKLARMYMKRVKVELESVRNSERESTQEALVLQGVHFAYRAHQFAGGLDSETLCAFEEIRQRVPGHRVGSRELLRGIPFT